MSFSPACPAINSNRNQLCEAISLVTHLQSPTICFSLKKHSLQYSLKFCPVFTSVCFRLQLLSQAASSGSLWNICVCRAYACVYVCVYLSLDLFLGAVCLSPPDCNPAVLGSMFCNLSLTVGVCVHHEFVFFVCQCCVIYRHLTTVGRFGTIQRFHPTLNARPKLCSWAQISCPLPTPVESQQKQSRRNWVTFTAKSLLL